MALRLPAWLDGYEAEDAAEVGAHLKAVGLASEKGMLSCRFSAARLAEHMRGNKMWDGMVRFVLVRRIKLVRGIGAAFTSGNVPGE